MISVGMRFGGLVRSSGWAGGFGLRDSFVHFFYNCPVTNNLLFQWTRVFEPPPDINSLNFKKLYWYGYNDTSNDLSGTLCIVMDIFKYAIWKSKQRRHLPNILALSREISFILDVACTASRTFRLTTANINLISNLFSEAEHRHLHFSSSLLFMN